jgi:hypothetical protein
MGSVSPIVVALAILSLVGFVGAVIAFVRRGATFRGYEEITADARALTRLLKGTLFRDGDDLVVAGNMEGWPATVRFSRQENTPGMTLRMEVPSTFTVSVVPQGSLQAEGRALIRTGDAQFDGRFTTRTDQPTQARMLLTMRRVAGDFQKLCCSSKTFVSMSPGALEVAELIVPESYVERHVGEHLRQMAAIGKALHDLPGGESVKIQPIRYERNIAGRLAIVVGIVAAIGTVVVAVEERGNTNPSAYAAETKTIGVMPADAALIPGVQNWRLAVTSDFDASAVTWARNNSIDVVGRIPGNFSGNGEGRDVAYILRRADGTFRVVMLCNGGSAIDVNYDSLALVVRLPKSAIGSIPWVGQPLDGDPDGDGLLVAYRPGDPTASVALFKKGDRIISAAPANYQNLNF